MHVDEHPPIPDEEIDAEVQAREEQAQEDAKGYKALAQAPRFEVFPEVEDALLGDDPVYDKVPTGQFVWHFKDANGHITFTGGESFARREGAHRSIQGMAEDVAVCLGAVRGALLHGAIAHLPIVDLDENGDVT